MCNFSENCTIEFLFQKLETMSRPKHIVGFFLFDIGKYIFIKKIINQFILKNYDLLFTLFFV